MALELGIDYPDEAVARKVMCQPDNLSSELQGSKLLFSFSCELPELYDVLYRRIPVETEVRMITSRPGRASQNHQEQEGQNR